MKLTKINKVIACTSIALITTTFAHELIISKSPEISKSKVNEDTTHKEKVLTVDLAVCRT
jgi:hypothetical protein